MTNEEILDNLRENTSHLLSVIKNSPEILNDMTVELEEICNDFIQLDISLSYNNGELPGAWGSSKLSKSKLSEPGPFQDGVYHISDT